MRFYRLVIDGQVVETTENNPEALQIRFDISMVNRYMASFQTIEIEGIIPKYWDKSQNLTDKSIQLYAGMAAGLPLAKPLQSGLIFSGSIQRAYKVVQGTSAKLVIMARLASIADPLQGFVIEPGVNIAVAAAQAMQTASLNVTIDPGLSVVAKRRMQVAPADVTTLAQSLETHGILLSISPAGLRLSLLESGSDGLPTVPIDYVDLIGQPTGTEQTYVTFQTAMRADIVPSQRIKLPTQTAAMYINPAGTIADLSPYLSQTGVYRVLEVQHRGDYRNTISAESWVSQFTCFPVK